MNEVMVYGCCAWSSEPAYEVGTEKTQLALFQLNPNLIHKRNADLWLRSVASSAAFADVSYAGFAAYNDASNTLGIRPAFGICA